MGNVKAVTFLLAILNGVFSDIQEPAIFVDELETRQAPEHQHHHAAGAPTAAELAAPLPLPMVGTGPAAAAVPSGTNQKVSPGMMDQCVLPDQTKLQCRPLLAGSYVCTSTAQIGGAGQPIPPFPIPGFGMATGFPYTKPVHHQQTGIPGPFLATMPGFQFQMTPVQGGMGYGLFGYSFTYAVPMRMVGEGIPSGIGIPGVTTIPTQPPEMTTEHVLETTTYPTTGETRRPTGTIETGTPTVTEMTPTPETTPTPVTGRPVVTPDLGLTRPVDATPPTPITEAEQQKVFVPIGPSPSLAGTVGGGFGNTVTLGPTGLNRTQVTGQAPFGEIGTIVRDPRLPACAYMLQTRVPDRQHCDRYYVCAMSGLVPQWCPDGLVFDLEREECHLPGSVNCTGRPMRQPPQSIGPCPRRNGVFPIQGSCTKFLICSNGTYGIVECPAGLAFSFSLGACEWPDVAGVPGCLSEQLFNFTCPHVASESGFLRVPNPRDCRSYYVCLPSGAARLLSCPGGTVFSPVKAVCDAPHRVPGCETYYGIPAPPSSPEGVSTIIGSGPAGGLSRQGDLVDGRALIGAQVPESYEPATI